ncbi:MAG: hypothetical protein IJ915_08980 [Paludibacteraceae bacterium]|nr:hypothetical protein [Paludibacteraceae bacterium]
MNQTNPNILTEDVVRAARKKLTASYDPIHLLQWAHSANFQMSIELKTRKREWNAMLQDGKAGREAKFEVRTPWADPSDCMDLLIATIYYHPNSPSADGTIFFITEKFYAIAVSGSHVVESPLAHFKTEQELMGYLADDETPFKRYLHLEHIMKRMRESEQGQEAARELWRRQKEKEQAEQDHIQAAKKTEHAPENLYVELTKPAYRTEQYEWQDMEEGMLLVKQSINGWWKPRFLIDENAHRAYEFMDSMLILQTLTDNDIDWNNLKGIPDKALERAKKHSGLYPTIIHHFHDGEAEVIWQINPDGRYYMDDDGFGMTDDDEIALCGTIDRTGHVIKKFHYND